MEGIGIILTAVAAAAISANKLLCSPRLTFKTFVCDIRLISLSSKSVTWKYMFCFIWHVLTDLVMLTACRSKRIQ